MKNNRKADEILAGLFGSISRARILELLVSQAGRVFYQREIMYATGLALRAVQRDMVRAFVEAVRAGGPAPIPFEEIYTVSLTTLRIMESLLKRQAVGLNLKSMTVI